MINKNIAMDMKICKSTVKRAGKHWLKHHEPIPLKKFGRKKKVTDENSEKLIISVQKEQKLGARRIERNLKLKYVLNLSFKLFETVGKVPNSKHPKILP